MEQRAVFCLKVLHLRTMIPNKAHMDHKYHVHQKEIHEVTPQMNVLLDCTTVYINNHSIDG